MVTFFPKEEGLGLGLRFWLPLRLRLGLKGRGRAVEAEKLYESLNNNAKTD